MIEAIKKYLSSNSGRPPLTEVAQNDGVMRRDVYDNCKQYPVGDPENHVDHEAFWTRASGVFYCRDCGSWYRTWRRDDITEEDFRL